MYWHGFKKCYRFLLVLKLLNFVFRENSMNCLVCCIYVLMFLISQVHANDEKGCLYLNCKKLVITLFETLTKPSKTTYHNDS